MASSLSQKLVARYFALLLAASGVVSAVVHPLPNLTDMTGGERLAITATCLIGALVIWRLPWDRWPAWSLLSIPPIGLGVKLWANLHGGLGPYSYSIHFVLIYVWMGVALPPGRCLAFAPLLAAAYVIPLALRGDSAQTASVAMVVPICVVIGESVAWISTRLRDAERVDGQRMAWMGWLVEASGDLAKSNGREELARCLARLSSELDAATGAAVLLGGGGRNFEVAAVERWPGSLPGLFVTQDEPALLETVRSREGLSQADASCAALGKKLGVPSLSIAPILGSGSCKAIVLLARRAGAEALDAFTSQIVTTLVTQAGLAFDRVLANEALLAKSLRDELTGVGNRRAANVRLERLEPGEALLMIDLDHFKRVNDTLGHAAGDAVLSMLGDHLKRSLRDGDEVFRMGGEEFLVVLQTSGAGALPAGERLLEGWRLRDPETSFSGGMAVHEASRSAEATLAAADAALYAAKGAGRDQVREAASG